MHFDESAEEAEFRAEARQFLEAHAPVHDDADDDHSMFVLGEEQEHSFVKRGREWQRIKYDHGWAGIDWPKEYGGAGRTAVEDGIFRDEEERFISPWLTHNLGFGMAGGTIL